VIHHESGKILAGSRTSDGQGFRNSIAEMARGATLKARAGTNSTIGAVATNATLTKTETTKLAQMAHDGFARTINPVHTMVDGDTIFAVATGTHEIKGDLTTIGALAAEAMARAVNRAVLTATGISGYPAYRDLEFLDK
jgi:L-aminopeptidase/D-esterase-like protein